MWVWIIVGAALMLSGARAQVAELIESVGAHEYQTPSQLLGADFLYNIWEAQVHFKVLI